jgi:hypothetical protein
MYRIIYMVLAAFLINACGNKQPKADPTLVENPVSASTEISATSSDTSTFEGAIITFEKTEHEFGTIAEGEKAEYSFKFTNTGKKQLLITSAAASCGCTVPSYSKEPIAPGASGMIKVVFDSKYRLDRFEKYVTVLSNTSPAETKLYIRGLVVPSTQPKVDINQQPSNYKRTPIEVEDHSKHNHQ